MSDVPVSDSILILGTGALASLFAARLAATGVRVTMLGTWTAGLDALRRDGVRIDRPDHTEQRYPVHATSSVRDCEGTRLALVLVKSWQTDRAADQLAGCLSSDGLALTLQNGLGNREKLERALGASRVALGISTTGATLVGPGHVRPGGEGIISLGAASTQESQPQLDALADLMERAGFAVEIVVNTDALLWSKLAINAAINPLTALLRCPNGELLHRPSARTLMAAAAREAAAVAAALGLELTYPDPVAAVEDVAHRTGVNCSSMLQDVLRGASTEIDAICGAIATIGEQHGVSTPVNQMLWHLIRAVREREHDPCA
jgi:2-dehydropantoate 2-reductase